MLYLNTNRKILKTVLLEIFFTVIEVEFFFIYFRINSNVTIRIILYNVE